MSIDDFLINPLEGLGLSLLVTSLWEFLSFDDSNLDALSHELVVEWLISACYHVEICLKTGTNSAFCTIV
jgi:hypothetical protein